MLRGIVQQMQDSVVQFMPQSLGNESATTQTSLERDAEMVGSVNEDEAEDMNHLPRDETTFEMREQVIGRRRLEYPVMQNELEGPRGEVNSSADANTMLKTASNVKKEKMRSCN